MVNIKDIPIGSLIKLKRMPLMTLRDSSPLKRWDSFGVRFLKLGEPMLLLDYNEGIDEIHGEVTRDIRKIFCIRILVMANENKFWLVLSSTGNTGAIYLPEDLKSDFRLTDKIELFEIENN